MNQRITKRERGLIKGSLRRVFSRSELRQQVVQASIIEHTDNSRKKVKTWCRCAECKKPEAKSYIVVDHILPLIPLDKAFDDMSLDEVVDRLWCDIKNLQPLCASCHSAKTKAENKLRRTYKKEKNEKRS